MPQWLVHVSLISVTEVLVTQWLVPVCFIFVSGGSVTEWLVLVCACVSQYSSDWFLELPFFIL